MELINKMLHGADYNPEQWRNTLEIWQKDIEYMKKANCNVMSIGIFSWAALEPQEGNYDFSWLDAIVALFEKNDLYFILATPSASSPVWMRHKYKEIMRTGENRVQNLIGGRHNHCYTSPVYRQKTREINEKLAERYKNSKSLLLWHISNEINGECHCALCQNAFREWLKNRYDNDLEKLNFKWWTTFWSQTYSDWAEIESPSSHGQHSLMGLSLDWKRFVTHQSIAFLKNEMEPIRRITPNIPVTTNYTHLYFDLDYRKMAKEIDIVSWDSYPMWHEESSDVDLARSVSFVHDMHRSYKGQPFLLMESTPSMTNWQLTGKLKRPKMHMLSSMQAVAHGSDSVQYFQWRKSRGGPEKLHGAIIGHAGTIDTRVFKDVAAVGDVLSKLDCIAHAKTHADVAIVMDTENFWAINFSEGPRIEKGYFEVCQAQYSYFWNNGISVDIISADCDFSKYKLVIAPMLYMVRDGCAKSLENFVECGGTLVLSYLSGIADENDLCFSGGFPGPLRKLAGIWAEEIDSVYDHDKNAIQFLDGNALGMKGEFEAEIFFEIIHTETAQTLAVYQSDFYKDYPALTVNQYGKGSVYYVASRNKQAFNDAFYEKLCLEAGIKKLVDTKLPYGVTVQKREKNGREYLFVMNFSNEDAAVELKNNKYIIEKFGYKIIENCV